MRQEILFYKRKAGGGMRFRANWRLKSMLSLRHAPVQCVLVRFLIMCVNQDEASGLRCGGDGTCRVSRPELCLVRANIWDVWKLCFRCSEGFKTQRTERREGAERDAVNLAFVFLSRCLWRIRRRLRARPLLIRCPCRTMKAGRICE